MLEEKYEDQRDLVTVLVDGLNMPRSFKRMDYQDLKTVVITAFNNKMLNKEHQVTTRFQDTETFLKNCLSIDGVKTVSMSFHSGWYWHDNQTYVDLLKRINTAGIDVYVLVNPSATITAMARQMKDAQLSTEYPGF